VLSELPTTVPCCEPTCTTLGRKPATLDGMATIARRGRRPVPSACVAPENMPRNLRIPGEIWDPFGDNVGERRKSAWIKDFMTAVNLAPQTWREFKAIAEARGETFPQALVKAISLYRSNP
jgi:hypothetical protein